jgi:hypothetical protein
MATMSDLVQRHAQSLVSEALEDIRVVLVNGARQAGKSTLTRLSRASRLGRAGKRPGPSALRSWPSSIAGSSATSSARTQAGSTSRAVLPGRFWRTLSSSRLARLSELRISQACGIWRATLVTSSSPDMSSIPASRPSPMAAGSKPCQWTRSGFWRRDTAARRYRGRSAWRPAMRARAEAMALAAASLTASGPSPYSPSMSSVA